MAGGVIAGVETHRGAAPTSVPIPVRVPFGRAVFVPSALAAIAAAIEAGHHAGNGDYTADCHSRLRRLVPGTFPLITHSGTAALEMAALLLELQPGDEVIMPSWTFSSTANAVVLRGAVPVFVDIRSDTLNVDEAEVEAALTDRTKAVFCVHYAGVACAMDRLQSFCTARGLALVEDAAQAVHATWRGRRLGGIGDFGVFSFHASKNVTAGEGGALLVNRPAAAARAEMVWEKGTDRARFSRNDVEFYRWQTIGSSFLPSEIIAALLATQLAAAAETTRRRLAAWRYYDARLRHLPGADALVFPDIPQEAGHNGHIYHLRTSNRPDRDRLRRLLRLAGIETATHYEPLHTSPAGLRYGRSAGRLDVTLQAATTLLRLPLDGVITTAEQDLVIEAVAQALPQLG